jgi:hypothetical protein
VFLKFFQITLECEYLVASDGGENGKVKGHDNVVFPFVVLQGNLALGGGGGKGWRHITHRDAVGYGGVNRINPWQRLTGCALYGSYMLLFAC